MDYLCVHDWDVWQSYRADRGTPPWIKVHRGLTMNPKWAMLSDAQKGQMISIWIVAADNEGRVPANSRIVKKICGLDDEPDLDFLCDIGLLAPWRQDDVKVTSSRRQGDAPELEVEREEEEEKTLKPSNSNAGAREEVDVDILLSDNETIDAEPEPEPDRPAIAERDQEQAGYFPEKAPIRAEKMAEVEGVFERCFDEHRSKIIELFPKLEFDIERSKCAAHYRCRPVPVDPWPVVLKWCARSRDRPKIAVVGGVRSGGEGKTGPLERQEMRQRKIEEQMRRLIGDFSDEADDVDSAGHARVRSVGYGA